jgi:hypothetical protein
VVIYLTLRFSAEVLPLFCRFVVLNLLGVVESRQNGPFGRRDVHEHILAATRRLDEPITP